MFRHQRQAGTHKAGRLGAGDVVAFEANVARGRAQEPGHGVQQCRLPSPIGPPRHQLTRTNLQRGAVQVVMAP